MRNFKVGDVVTYDGRTQAKKSFDFPNGFRAKVIAVRLAENPYKGNAFDVQIDDGSGRWYNTYWLRKV